MHPEDPQMMPMSPVAVFCADALHVLYYIMLHHIILCYVILYYIHIYIDIII